MRENGSGRAGEEEAAKLALGGRGLGRFRVGDQLLGGCGRNRALGLERRFMLAHGSGSWKLYIPLGNLADFAPGRLG